MARFTWRGKSALVMGGSKGLGRFLAHELGRRGARVTIAARDYVALDQTCEELSRHGGEYRAVAADATTDQGVAEMLAAASDWNPGLDAVFSCVGKSDRGRALDLTPEVLRRAFEVNVLPAVRLARACGEALEASHGHFVVVGSLASKLTPRFLGTYTATKHALAGYVGALRQEWAEQGVHVMLVCPGPIARPDAGERYADLSEDLPDAAGQPGAGAKVKAIDPQRLAADILHACEKRKAELVVPKKARLLMAITALYPAWGGRLLRGRSA